MCIGCATPRQELDWAAAVAEHGYDPKSGLPHRVVDRQSGIEMALVKPGWFTRGSSDSKRPWERPARRVLLRDAFYIARFEISNAQWERVMPPTRVGAIPEYPVVMVDLLSARKFAKRIGMRVPTEKEWEAACRRLATRAGAHQLHACSDRAGTSGAARDMLGNVAELVDDLDDEGYERELFPVRDDQEGRRLAVLRGGSWRSRPEWRTAHLRSPWDAEWVETTVGFRVARDP